MEPINNPPGTAVDNNNNNCYQTLENTFENSINNNSINNTHHQQTTITTSPHDQDFLPNNNNNNNNNQHQTQELTFESASCTSNDTINTQLISEDEVLEAIQQAITANNHHHEAKMMQMQETVKQLQLNALIATQQFNQIIISQQHELQQQHELLQQKQYNNNIANSSNTINNNNNIRYNNNIATPQQTIIPQHLNNNINSSPTSPISQQPHNNNNYNNNNNNNLPLYHNNNSLNHQSLLYNNNNNFLNSQSTHNNNNLQSNHNNNNYNNYNNSLQLQANNNNNNYNSNNNPMSTTSLNSPPIQNLFQSSNYNNTQPLANTQRNNNNFFTNSSSSNKTIDISEYFNNTNPQIHNNIINNDSLPNHHKQRTYNDNIKNFTFPPITSSTTSMEFTTSLKLKENANSLTTLTQLMMIEYTTLSQHNIIPPPPNTSKYLFEISPTITQNFYNYTTPKYMNTLNLDLISITDQLSAVLNNITTNFITDFENNKTLQLSHQSKQQYTDAQDPSTTIINLKNDLRSLGFNSTQTTPGILLYTKTVQAIVTFLDSRAQHQIDQILDSKPNSQNSSPFIDNIIKLIPLLMAHKSPQQSTRIFNILILKMSAHLQNHENSAIYFQEQISSDAITSHLDFENHANQTIQHIIQFFSSLSLANTSRTSRTNQIGTNGNGKPKKPLAQAIVSGSTHNNQNTSTTFVSPTTVTQPPITPETTTPPKSSITNYSPALTNPTDTSLRAGAYTTPTGKEIWCSGCTHFKNQHPTTYTSTDCICKNNQCDCSPDHKHFIHPQSIIDMKDPLLTNVNKLSPTDRHRFHCRHKLDKLHIPHSAYVKPTIP
jgi:hypothetical protein